MFAHVISQGLPFRIACAECRSPAAAPRARPPPERAQHPLLSRATPPRARSVQHNNAHYTSFIATAPYTHLLANVQVSISMIAERPHVHDFTKAIQQHALQTVCSLATLRAQSAGLSVRVSTRSATETAHLRLLYTGHLLSVCGCAV